MVKNQEEFKNLENICDDFVNYAIDRQEMKEIMASLPEMGKHYNILEYELQLLRILSVGWAIAFFVNSEFEKKFLLENFWIKIQNFSIELSFRLSKTVSQNIDYFDLIKSRIKNYVNSLNAVDEFTKDPVEIIGPEFARICNLNDDACAILVGSKFFNLTVSAVKEHLNIFKLVD